MHFQIQYKIIYQLSECMYLSFTNSIHNKMLFFILIFYILRYGDWAWLVAAQALIFSQWMCSFSWLLHNLHEIRISDVIWWIYFQTWTIKFDNECMWTKIQVAITCFHMISRKIICTHYTCRQFKMHNTYEFAHMYQLAGI